MAGGACRDLKWNQPAAVFADTNDAGYQALLALITAGKDYLAKDTRFDMPDFRPRVDWVREMKRYGVLADGLKPGDVTDVYAVEAKYWESLWHRPVHPRQASQ